jgi:hypothetical protein
MMPAVCPMNPPQSNACSPRGARELARAIGESGQGEKLMFIALPIIHS